MKENLRFLKLKDQRRLNGFKNVLTFYGVLLLLVQNVMIVNSFSLFGAKAVGYSSSLVILLSVNGYHMLDASSVAETYLPVETPKQDALLLPKMTVSQRSPRKLGLITSTVSLIKCLPKFFCSMNARDQTWNDLAHLIKFSMKNDALSTINDEQQQQDLSISLISDPSVIGNSFSSWEEPKYPSPSPPKIFTATSSEEDSKSNSKQEYDHVEIDLPPGDFPQHRGEDNITSSSSSPSVVDKESPSSETAKEKYKQEEALVDELLTNLEMEMEATKSNNDAQIVTILSDLNEMLRSGRSINNRGGRAFWENKNFRKQMAAAAKIRFEDKANKKLDELCSSTFNMCPYTVAEMKYMIQRGKEKEAAQNQPNELDHLFPQPPPLTPTPPAHYLRPPPLTPPPPPKAARIATTLTTTTARPLTVVVYNGNPPPEHQYYRGLAAQQKVQLPPPQIRRLPPSIPIQQQNRPMSSEERHITSLRPPPPPLLESQDNHSDDMNNDDDENDEIKPHPTQSDNPLLSPTGNALATFLKSIIPTKPSFVQTTTEATGNNDGNKQPQHSNGEEEDRENSEKKQEKPSLRKFLYKSAAYLGLSKPVDAEQQQDDEAEETSFEVNINHRSNFPNNNEERNDGEVVVDDHHNENQESNNDHPVTIPQQDGLDDDYSARMSKALPKTDDGRDNAIPMEYLHNARLTLSSLTTKRSSRSSTEIEGEDDESIEGPGLKKLSSSSEEDDQQGVGGTTSEEDFSDETEKAHNNNKRHHSKRHKHHKSRANPPTPPPSPIIGNDFKKVQAQWGTDHSSEEQYGKIGTKKHKQKYQVQDDFEDNDYVSPSRSHRTSVTTSPTTTTTSTTTTPEPAPLYTGPTIKYHASAAEKLKQWEMHRLHWTKTDEVGGLGGILDSSSSPKIPSSSPTTEKSLTIMEMLFGKSTTTPEPDDTLKIGKRKKKPSPFHLSLKNALTSEKVTRLVGKTVNQPQPDSEEYASGLLARVQAEYQNKHQKISRTKSQQQLQQQQQSEDVRKKEDDEEESDEEEEDDDEKLWKPPRSSSSQKKKEKNNRHRPRHRPSSPPPPFSSKKHHRHRPKEPQEDARKSHHKNKSSHKEQQKQNPWSQEDAIVPSSLPLSSYDQSPSYTYRPSYQNQQQQQQQEGHYQEKVVQSQPPQPVQYHYQSQPQTAPTGYDPSLLFHHPQQQSTPVGQPSFNSYQYTSSGSPPPQPVTYQQPMYAPSMTPPQQPMQYGFSVPPPPPPPQSFSYFRSLESHDNDESMNNNGDNMAPKTRQIQQQQVQQDTTRIRSHYQPRNRYPSPTVPVRTTSTTTTTTTTTVRPRHRSHPKTEEQRIESYGYPKSRSRKNNQNHHHSKHVGGGSWEEPSAYDDNDAPAPAISQEFSWEVPESLKKPFSSLRESSFPQNHQESHHAPSKQKSSHYTSFRDSNMVSKSRHVSPTPITKRSTPSPSYQQTNNNVKQLRSPPSQKPIVSSMDASSSSFSNGRNFKYEHSSPLRLRSYSQSQKSPENQRHHTSATKSQSHQQPSYKKLSQTPTETRHVQNPSFTTISRQRHHHHQQQQHGIAQQRQQPVAQSRSSEVQDHNYELDAGEGEASNKGELTPLMIQQQQTLQLFLAQQLKNLAEQQLKIAQQMPLSKNNRSSKSERSKG